MQSDKKLCNDKRRIRIRKRVIGTADRPRLSVRFSGKHIYAQCINDDHGLTLVFLSTLNPEIRQYKISSNVTGAVSFGKEFGKKMLASGIKQVVFDRGGRKYHGCVKSFAESVREMGLSF